jgi:hypothetical protein
LDQYTRNALKAHDEYSFGTLLGGGTETVSDGVLGLDAEEEAAGKAEDVVDARGPIVLHLDGRQVTLVKITVSEGNQPPDHRESQPGQEEAQNEAYQRPTPLRIYQSREDVLQKAQRSSGDARLQHVAIAILQDGATA